MSELRELSKEEVLTELLRLARAQIRQFDSDIAALRSENEQMRAAALQAFLRTWAYHVDIDGPPDEYKATFLDRLDKALATLARVKDGAK